MSDMTPFFVFCAGKPDNYVHTWVCGDGYCSGFNPAPESNSVILELVKSMTIGTPGRRMSEEPVEKYKTDEYCQEAKPPKKCDQKKFDQCVKEKSAPGIQGRYQAFTNQCVLQTMTVIGECLKSCTAP